MNIIISVFFSGSNHKISDNCTLAGLLKDHIDTKTDQIAIGFDGCGETHGFSGAIFGTGLDEQCKEVIATIQEQFNQNNTVTLNIYGFSRGGVAALMLAKQLSAIEPSQLNINLALLDPVPGNFIMTSDLDPFDISLANKTMDLRECKPLKNVLALYPHEPLPSIACHAPLFGLYPKGTKVEEDVIAGCHAGAQRQMTFCFCQQTFISFARMHAFFIDNGSQFKTFRQKYLYSETADKVSQINLDTLNETLIDIYQDENKLRYAKNDRESHSATGMYIKTKEQAEFFNLHHQRLSGVPENRETARVTIEVNYGPISRLKRLILNHPTAWSILKWTALSVALTSLLFFTGGLAPIVFLLGGSLNLGLLSVVAAAPVVGIISAGLWYSAFKSLLETAINRFFYPHYKRCDIQSTLGSTPGMIKQLSDISKPPAPHDLIDCNHTNLFEPEKTNHDSVTPTISENPDTSVNHCVI